MKVSPRHLAITAAGLGAAIAWSGGAGHAGVPVLDQEPVDLGAVVIVDGNDQTTPLASGGSNTVFTMLPPEGSTCPGDSANDQWRVHSFMIPVDQDPGGIEYGSEGPDSVGQYVVWETNSTGYVDELLVQNQQLGEPGRLPEPPLLTFATYLPGGIEMGRYRIGFACTFFRQTAHYWDTEIELVADSADFPAQFRWEAAQAPDGAVDVEATSGGGRNNTLFLGGAAAVLIGGAVYFWMRVQAGRDEKQVTQSRVDEGEHLEKST